MKQYLPHILLVIGIVIFANGALMFVYTGSIIAAILPLIGAALAVYGFLRLRGR